MNKALEPTDEQIDLAVQWLEHCEGQGPDAKACEVVAEWLSAILAEREFNKFTREAARKAGVPVDDLRRAYRSQSMCEP